MSSSPLAFHHLPLVLILVVLMANGIAAFPDKIDPIVQPGGKAPPKKDEPIPGQKNPPNNPPKGNPPNGNPVEVPGHGQAQPELVPGQSHDNGEGKKKGFHEHADNLAARILVCRTGLDPSDLNPAKNKAGELDLEFKNTLPTLVKEFENTQHENGNRVEEMVENGEAIGLPEVIPAKKAMEKPFQAGPFRADMDLVEVGNAEMAEQLRKMGDQGDEYASLILYGPTRKYFSAKAGFVQRETRLARNLYCLKELANLIKHGLNKDEKENKETYQVQYAIFGVYINSKMSKSDNKKFGATITDVMKDMIKKRGELAELVNKPANFIYNGTDRDKIRALRKEALEGFAELARRESEDGDKPSSGSSMALVGAIWQSEPKVCGNNCLSFYHISANDSYVPNYGDSFETLF